MNLYFVFSILDATEKKLSIHHVSDSVNGCWFFSGSTCSMLLITFMLCTFFPRLNPCLPPFQPFVPKMCHNGSDINKRQQLSSAQVYICHGWLCRCVLNMNVVDWNKWISKQVFTLAFFVNKSLSSCSCLSELKWVETEVRFWDMVFLRQFIFFSCCALCVLIDTRYTDVCILMQLKTQSMRRDTVFTS